MEPTGADLDGVMIKAKEIALDRGAEASTGADIVLALSLLRPGSDSEQAREMIEEALTYCNDLSLIPPQWRSHISG